MHLSKFKLSSAENVISSGNAVSSGFAERFNDFSWLMGTDARTLANEASSSAKPLKSSMNSEDEFKGD
jgi:hypothetical protein